MPVVLGNAMLCVVGLGGIAAWEVRTAQFSACSAGSLGDPSSSATLSTTLAGLGAAGNALTSRPIDRRSPTTEPPAPICKP
jgi:hypothetical protein